MAIAIITTHHHLLLLLPQLVSSYRHRYLFISQPYHSFRSTINISFKNLCTRTQSQQQQSNWVLFLSYVASLIVSNIIITIIMVRRHRRRNVHCRSCHHPQHQQYLRHRNNPGLVDRIFGGKYNGVSRSVLCLV